MLLYISGSFPDNQEGIASGAKVLLDAIVRVVDKKDVLLLTTDIPIVSNNIQNNSIVEYKLLNNWRVTPTNVKYVYNILEEYPIKAIHMEYPGDLYGKTFLASFLPLFIKLYNKKNRTNITFNVRLHEFSRARFLRKLAIIPILWFADAIYVPALKDRNITSKFGGNKVKPTTIGTNIRVVSDELSINKKKTISYFGSVYPGKGIERMLKIWKKIKEMDENSVYTFKLIGDIGVEESNHFASYHKQVWEWIDQYELRDCIEVTGYITDEEVSNEIRKTAIATLPYEDGLTLRRGSFLAYLSHGIPIVTTEGDEEATELFEGHSGVSMTSSDDDFIQAILHYGEMKNEEIEEIYRDNINLSYYFNWEKIAEVFMRDYGFIDK